MASHSPVQPPADHATRPPWVRWWPQWLPRRRRPPAEPGGATGRAARGAALLLLAASLAAGPGAVADTVRLRPDHPERYVVRKGDTLWDIAKRFLKDPWQWPRIWKANPQIRNPHLIYPGDVIVLRWEGGRPRLELERAGQGRPTVKLHPRVRVSEARRPVPTIPAEAIQPFLARTSIAAPEELARAGYVLAMEEGRLVAGTGHRVYARALPPAEGGRYRVVRRQRAYRGPGGELLGYEVVELAQARLVQAGDPATLLVTRAYRELLPQDLVLPAGEEPPLPPTFQPAAAPARAQGHIVGLFDALSGVGRYQVVALDLGRAQGVEPGHVLAVYRQGDEVRDPRRREAVRLPPTRAGLVMVFRSFQRISYALVMDATRALHQGDSVRAP
ncbi:MAG: LysM domain-containing protein [Gammaproteobacteria bacterium]|nr:MAG: LysM domain-containing protein [Gammaproteobacteria bacterium]